MASCQCLETCFAHQTRTKASHQGPSLLALTEPLPQNARRVPVVLGPRPETLKLPSHPSPAPRIRPECTRQRWLLGKTVLLGIFRTCQDHLRKSTIDLPYRIHTSRKKGHVGLSWLLHADLLRAQLGHGCRRCARLCRVPGWCLGGAWVSCVDSALCTRWNGVESILIFRAISDPSSQIGFSTSEEGGGPSLDDVLPWTW